MKGVRPTLLVLAAGMGSRYGGLKQLDGLGPHGETIMDYSIYDAIHAGFGKVVFVIRKDIEDDFRDKILSKYLGTIPVDVVYQDINSLPGDFVCPKGRTKPWGTNHAVLMASTAIKEPFAVINADDFYGREAYETAFEQLSHNDGTPGNYCIVGFHVGNTMSPAGPVARGVCETAGNGNLAGIAERKDIHYDSEGRIAFTDETGTTRFLDPVTPVSMNLWGLTHDYFDMAREEFARFIAANIDNPKAEMTIPDCVDKLIRRGYIRVKVVDTPSRWFGVTYAADRQGVVDKFAELHRIGAYPDRLFGRQGR